MTRHRASQAYSHDGRAMCSCGREVLIKTVRSRYGSQSPIRNQFGMASWRASHGPVLDRERYAAWQEKRAARA